MIIVVGLNLYSTIIWTLGSFCVLLFCVLSFWLLL